MYEMFFLIIFAALGLFMIVSPESIYDGESWKNATDSEPSKAYLITTRIAGTVLLFGSIVGVIVSVIKIYIWLN